MYGDRKSQLTFLLYLNDDFEGGHTSFFEEAAGEKPGPGDKICAVKVPQGGALCFFHGTVHKCRFRLLPLPLIAAPPVPYSFPPGLLDASLALA
jgi:hypothetical protein